MTYPQPKKKHTGRNVVFAVGGLMVLAVANDGLLGDIVANDFLTAPGQMTFTAKKGEYVEVRGCTFTKVG